MERIFHTGVRIPKGIDISEPTINAGPDIETCACGKNSQTASCICGDTDNDTSWSYLFVHNSKVNGFAERLQKDNINFFVHKTVVYRRNKHTRGIQTIYKPTVSGLIFLQGTPGMLQAYLDDNFPNRHLVKNCSTHLAAVIPDKVMQPFMRVLETSPERVRFLLHPFRYYAEGNIKLRITSGFFAGIEGYVVRIDRDRRLVMDVGGMSVAISGVHCDKFEVVEETL